jgi:uncharacterized alkaline shock family protein YloU
MSTTTTDRSGMAGGASEYGGRPEYERAEQARATDIGATAPAGREVAGRDVTGTEGGTALTTPRGRTSISDAVVRKIAGVATREVAGVHDLGTGGSRAVGSIRQRIPGSSSNVARGVSVEVGQRQAAVDLDIVVDYGVSIIDLSRAVRGNVITSVESMTGLEVTEVNVAVDDVYLQDEDDQSARVQ